MLLYGLHFSETFSQNSGLKQACNSCTRCAVRNSSLLTSVCMWAVTTGSVVVHLAVYTSTVTCLTNSPTGLKDGSAVQKQRAGSWPEQLLFNTTAEALQWGIQGGSYSRYGVAKLFLCICYSSSRLLPRLVPTFTPTTQVLHLKLTGCLKISQCIIVPVWQENRFVWLVVRSSSHSLPHELAFIKQV